MKHYAHRGRVRDGDVDNTLEAFDAAIRLGVTGIETDVRPCRDGTLVLYHDRRLADGSLVAELGLEELRTRAGVEVPTLVDALAAWPHISWNLEIKDRDAASGLVACVRERNPRHVLVSSFDHVVVAHIGEEVSWDLGLLISHAPADPAAFARGLGTRAETLICDWQVLHASAVRAYREAGKRVGVYNATPNDIDGSEYRDQVDLAILDNLGAVVA